MEGVTLKSRAVFFALCVGGVAFILSLIATSDVAFQPQGLFRAVAVAIVCAAMSWASAQQALAGIAEAIDIATTRIEQAAEGDLKSPTPAPVAEALPNLASALDGMFAQVDANLDSATVLASFDPVTSLPNRMHFRREAERVLASLHDGEMCALAFIDLDYFKAVNDTLGHAQGDQVLARVANRLRAVAAGETVRYRDGDHDPIIGRLAGDEFTMLLPHVDGIGDAARFGERLLASLARPFDIAGQQLHVGASIGLALSPDHGATLTALMRAADVAMYHAKASGRGQFQFYADQLAERVAERSRLEHELRDAIARDEFTIVFQPQVALADGRVLAAEGLLRWQHPRDGLRLPASFIPCAEENGLIAEIGDWAIEELACRAAVWPADPLAPRFAVNLSPRQIARPDFFIRLRKALDRTQAPLHLIEFEVGEAVLMQCGPPVLDALRDLRSAGATIAIDDFGTGSSSLARLRSLPFDVIKLDASLIHGIDSDPAARDVAQAVIGLAHSLAARTVAEGVETQAQYDILRVMGCDAAQGYAIAPPMTEVDYRAWAGSAADRMRA